MPDLDISAHAFFKQLTRLPFVERIVLYGSRARGDHRPMSDIDLAIIATATPREWSTVMDIIEGADTLLDIDCIDYNTLPNESHLKDNIDHEGIVLYDQQT